MRHLLEIDDLTPSELASVLELAELETEQVPRVLSGRSAALLFEKPSLRTRNSMEVAVVQLGGHPLSMVGDEVGLDSRETVEDVTRTLSCYHAVIGARVFEHSKLARMAAISPVPVINMLSDDAHPLQALADLLTIRQELGELKGRKIAYIGDANNVWRSLALAAAMSDMQMALSCPQGFGPGAAELSRIAAVGEEPEIAPSPAEAAAGADVVYTDVWTSMGQEQEVERRRRAFEGFTIDAGVMETAGPEAIFLHCLPAHRGEEVTDEVIEGSRSRVWRQAANRMHAARGLLVWIMREAG